MENPDFQNVECIREFTHFGNLDCHFLNVFRNLHILELRIVTVGMYSGINTFWKSGLSFFGCIREFAHSGNLDCQFFGMCSGICTFLELRIVKEINAKH